MHILQSKHTKLNQKDAQELLDKLNISRSQLPKIKKEDSALHEGCEIGDIIKIVRKDPELEEVIFHRVVV